MSQGHLQDQSNNYETHSSGAGGHTAMIFCTRFFSTDIYVFLPAESIPDGPEVKNTGFDDLYLG